jgi:hypothetical protein
VSFDLISGTVVDVDPPEVPRLLQEPPSGPLVTVVPPVVPTAAVAPPVLPRLVVSPPVPGSTPVIIVPGPPGPPGTGGAQTYEHDQLIPQSVWIVPHQFGRYPVAWSLFDTTGRLCDEYTVEHTDLNTSRVSMDTPTAGLIRLI